MVGGGKLAARKLPELLACGAKVTVIAPELSPVTKRLLPGLHWQEREFRPEDVQGYRLVFACADTPTVNTAVSEACKTRSIPCNRADAADRGDFIVPGLIRRGEVTVSISTGGQAPSLTKHLKRKLSAALGEEWGALAALVAQARSVADAEALNALPYDELAEAMRRGNSKTVRDILPPIPGWNPPSPVSSVSAIAPVLLIGTGPGDRSLLTVAAAEALKNAEVAVHDRLVDSGILSLLPESCRRISAEKRGHFESKRQEHINALLIEQARAGKRVVRLKGGDPFVFGRGFEEALALEAAAIPWRVLPGLSSATAVPALAGIPLTHRGTARSFAVASGMADGKANSTFPKADTLVLLMALFRLEEIIPALIRSGYAPETPAAAIQGGGLPDQRICRSTLKKLHEDTAKQGFDSPTLIVVGEVVGLSSKGKTGTAVS